MPDPKDQNLNADHAEDAVLSEYDQHRLGRVLHDPERTMHLYRIGDHNQIIVCGAHFDFPAFMATLRSLIPAPAPAVDI